jgi:hypothetical protein
MSHDGSIVELVTVEFKRLLPGDRTSLGVSDQAGTAEDLVQHVALEPRVGGAIEVRFTDGKGECGALASTASATSVSCMRSRFRATT